LEVPKFNVSAFPLDCWDPASVIGRNLMSRLTDPKPPGRIPEQRADRFPHRPAPLASVCNDPRQEIAAPSLLTFFGCLGDAPGAQAKQHTQAAKQTASDSGLQYGAECLHTFRAHDDHRDRMGRPGGLGQSIGR
jgi:hypothetical protein